MEMVLQADALARELAGDDSANTLSSGSAGTGGVDGGSVASEAAEDAVALRRMEQMQGIVSAVLGFAFVRNSVCMLCVRQQPDRPCPE